MIIRFFTPTTLGGAFRRVSLAFIALAVICAFNKWHFWRDPGLADGLPGRGGSGAIELAHDLSTWPYIIGFAFIGMLAQVLAQACDGPYLDEESDEGEAPERGPTIH